MREDKAQTTAPVEAGEKQPDTDLKLEFILCAEQGSSVVINQAEVLIGSAETCAVRLQDHELIAPEHCRLERCDDRWQLTPIGDHAVWVNDQRILEPTELEQGSMVFLGKLMGPGFRIGGAGPRHVRPNRVRERLREVRAFRNALMASAAKAAAEKPFQRRVIQRAFSRQRRLYSRRLIRLSVALFIAVVGGGGVLYYQQTRVDAMRALAESIFYQMKSIELQVARVEDIAAVTGDSTAIEQSAALWRQFRHFEQQYDAYLQELGFGDRNIPEDERLILKVARIFGESELHVPPEFIRTVRTYIKKWQTTPRYREAISRGMRSGYIEHIVDMLVKNHLPPHLVYLALQESDFDTNRCGPRTRYGIAKGMWQFIPTTAVYFGLRLGPLVEVRTPDPRDERHHFEKSTSAAVRYLRLLYTTEAQASALLVMASYNWGESKIRRLIADLPENPRERNFWNLMKRYPLPRETRDYVFYIFSAAVIGENPTYFGFNIDNPLASVLN